MGQLQLCRNHSPLAPTPGLKANFPEWRGEQNNQVKCRTYPEDNTARNLKSKMKMFHIHWHYRACSLVYCVHLSSHLA